MQWWLILWQVKRLLEDEVSRIGVCINMDESSMIGYINENH